MKIKSALMTQASGSIAGMTAAHNRGGLYLRARSIPVNTNTTQQQAIRSIMSSTVAAWGDTLTDAQRSAWGEYGAAVGTVNSFGDTIPLSGIAAYVQANVPRIQAGLTRVDDGPTTYSLPDFGGITDVAASEATQGLLLSFDDSYPWVDFDDTGLIVQVSRPQNATINYFNGPYRFAALVEGSTTAPPTSPAAITAPFPFVAGQKLFVRVRYSTAAGRLSSAARSFCVAAA